MKNVEMNNIQEIKEILYCFFPDSRIDQENNSQLLTENNEQVLLDSDAILSHLQTIFFEEHLVELQIDHSTRVFYANLLDNIPELQEEQSDDGLLVIEPDYETGSYLKEKQTFILTPLTPGIGNARIRSSKLTIIRYFTGTVAIEFGCLFRKPDTVRGEQVLRFDFPVIGRLNKNYRPYRVKAIASVDVRISIENHDSFNSTEEFYQIVDISAMGLGSRLCQIIRPSKSGITLG